MQVSLHLCITRTVIRMDYLVSPCASDVGLVCPFYLACASRTPGGRVPSGEPPLASASELRRHGGGRFCNHDRPLSREFLSQTRVRPCMVEHQASIAQMSSLVGGVPSLTAMLRPCSPLRRDRNSPGGVVEKGYHCINSHQNGRRHRFVRGCDRQKLSFITDFPQSRTYSQ